MVDGQQWFETYISKTVVQYVDQHYRTMNDPRARGVMGMSAGGFCAPMLTLRHPDVFSIAISFSGYFWAGGAGPNAERPFGGVPAEIQSHSPAVLAPQIPAEERSRLYFVIIADPAQDFYGPNAMSFDKILSTSGYKHLVVNSLYTHGWPQVRYESPGALQAWGAQLVVNGIW
jgi:S-formylglutathione hydrolase FrmB